jgi:hypothetical protein
MGKRFSSLHTWPWHADNHRPPANLVLNIIARPLFILAALLIVDGLISCSFSSLAIGVIGLIAGLAIQRNGD